MKLHLTVSCALLSMFVGQGEAAVVPIAGKVDARLRVAPYAPDQLYKLEGTLGYAIDLIVAPDEEFVGVAGGELEAVVIATHGHRLTIKPKVAPLATNFTAHTNLRAYQIEYHVSERDSEPQMFAVQFLYAPKPDLSPTPAEKVDRALNQAQPVLNTDYWYCGDLFLQPVRAFDDGLQTHLEFSPDTEWPAIYILNSDGSESLVNVSVRGNTAVIHRVFERVILRRGERVGCVLNRGWRLKGTPLRNGTVSPEVSRTLKELSR